MTTQKTETVSMVRVKYPEKNRTYYLSEGNFHYYFVSRGHLPQSNPAEHEKTLDAQSTVIVENDELILNCLWPTATANELMALMGEPALPVDAPLTYKSATYKGTTYFITGALWESEIAPTFARLGSFPVERATLYCDYAYKAGSTLKCTYACTVGNYHEILLQLKAVSQVVDLNEAPELVHIEPYKETYTLAEVKRLLDENAALKKDIARLESNQVWYVNALEVLRPFRYSAHQLLTEPDRLSHREALKKVLDMAETFFTKKDADKKPS